MNGKLGESLRKNRVLNQMIIKYGQSSSNELSDDEIENDAREIRQLIYTVIRTTYTNPEHPNINYKHAHQVGEAHFYERFRGRLGESRKRMLIARVFRIINAEIFNARWFGLDGEMGRQMQEFERLIQSSVKGW